MIRVARIVSIIGNADNGRFNAKHVKLAFKDSAYEVSAYAKKLGDLDLLVEIVSALIGIELKLPIPEPVLAISIDGKEAWFASIDVKHPDLSRRLLIENDQVTNTPQNGKILKQLADWPAIHDAIGFDEWIANSDRNTGNILYDGKDQFFLIDHNLAMRLPFSPSAPINNVLLNIKLAFTRDDVSKQRLKNQIIFAIEGINYQIPQSICERLLQQAENLDRQILTDMVDFLIERLHHLTPITKSKITTKQLSL